MKALSAGVIVSEAKQCSETQPAAVYPLSYLSTHLIGVSKIDTQYFATETEGA